MAELDSRAIRPCVKCGKTDRYSDGACRPCRIERSARYYLKNQPQCQKTKQAYRQKNLEKIRAKAAEYVQKTKERNKEKTALRHRLYHQNNKEKVRINKINRRARETANGSKLSKGIVEKLFAVQKGKCPCCGQPLGEDFHLDHIMPLAKDGGNVDSNVQLLRAKCNLQKQDRHPVDFMQSRGFLL